LLRLRSGSDPTGWHEFVRLYEPLLRCSVRRAGIPEHDVPDVVQDILVRLLHALPDFQYAPRRGRFRAWLHTVCRTSIIDWRRRRRRSSSAALADDDAVAPAFDESQWELDHRRHVLVHALSATRRQVSPSAWECFEQYVLQERSAAAVAAELRLTPAAVYVIASRIRMRIRRKCTQFDEDLA
jgi:RNA polymerase sigma factor (sigma-70 family)